MAKERGKEWEEYDNAVRWMTITFAIAVVVTVVFMYIAPILAFFMQNGISKKSVEIAGLFLKKSFADFGFFVGLVSEMVQKGLSLQRRV